MENMYEQIGERIKEVRVAKGFSREKLADLANISSKFLYEIESGRKGLSTENLYHISVALDVKTDYLITGKYAEIKDFEFVRILNSINEKELQKIQKLIGMLCELK